MPKGECCRRGICRGCHVMTIAAGMVMGSTLFTIRKLIAITLKVIGGLRGGGNAIGPLGRMRRASRPQHEDEEKRAKNGGPAVHWGAS